MECSAPVPPVERPERAATDSIERAAIMEIDGGLPRDWAEALAAICAGPRPQGCSKTERPGFVR